MTKKLLLVLALCAGVAVAAFAAPGAPVAAGKATVGEFAVRVAGALGLDATDAKTAVGALKGRGVTFAADLSATLTEGEAARIISDLGMAVVAPTNPGAAVSSARAGSLVAAIPASAGIEAISPEDEGPTQCLSSVDRGTCVDCCKASGPGLTGKFCGHYCHANVPPPVSPGEPTP
jgi:hypothetical protein